jgi:hypothetical protein
MDLLNQAKEIVQGIPQIAIFFLIALLGLYVFWRGSTESRKNRSSVFDMYLLSGFFAILVGRVVHIVLEWDMYTSYIWYWLPYEKYGDKVYLFRLLPWRFISIWDGGIVIFAAFLAFLLFMTFFSLVVKKWRWKDMFLTIYSSALSMLGFSFIYIGINTGYTGWIYEGAGLLATIPIYLLLYKFIDKISKKVRHNRYIFGYITVILQLVSAGYITYIYLTSRLSFLENILVGIFVIWSLVMSWAFLADLKRARVNIERVSTVRSV